MQRLHDLLERIIQRVNINLRETRLDAGAYVRNLIPFDKFIKFYAFCGITPYHPLSIRLVRANLAGSYLLGRCHVTDSILYKSDIRGDELKCKGDVFKPDGIEIPLYADETIRIKDSFLIKTLVHNSSHDPENPEDFTIRSTVSTHYANIHGSNVEGCFLAPFSTIDLTVLHDCVVGEFSYLQVRELNHQQIPAGTIWISSGSAFDFYYRYDSDVLARYIRFTAGHSPQGLLMAFVKSRKEDFQRIFDVVNLQSPCAIPASAALNRYAVVKPQTEIQGNVLVAQRAYLENAWLGEGADAQENCYIINSRLSGNNVTAHGAKVIQTELEHNVFVGFNSFLHGKEDARLHIGANSIVMPHTIIDLEEPVRIPQAQLIWGYIRNAQDVVDNSAALAELACVTDSFSRGRLVFKGDGAAFVNGFRNRIEHILEANGAYFDGLKHLGHAQKSHDIAYNLMRPYSEGDLQGLYPTIIIQ